jgi:hypothetical protein
MKLLSVEKTPADNKNKLIATFQKDDGKIKKVSFGVKNSFSYIDGADETIRNAYLARHKKDILNPDPTTKGNLSYYITWGPSKNLADNVKFYKKKFNV